MERKQNNKRARVGFSFFGAIVGFSIGYSALGGIEMGFIFAVALGFALAGGSELYSRRDR